LIGRVGKCTTSKFVTSNSTYGTILLEIEALTFDVESTTRTGIKNSENTTLINASYSGIERAIAVNSAFRAAISRNQIVVVALFGSIRTELVEPAVAAGVQGAVLLAVAVVRVEERTVVTFLWNIENHVAADRCIDCVRT